MIVGKESPDGGEVVIRGWAGSTKAG